MILISCADKKQEWFKNYAQTKCAYQTEQEKIKADSIKQISGLIADIEKTKKELAVFCSSYENKLAALNEQTKDVQKEYMRAYRKAEEIQSAKFGHRNTPAYEKELNKLENTKTDKMTTVQNKITQLKAEMESKSEYKKLTKQLKQAEEQIKITLETIIANHKVTVDSLQEELDVENSNFKRMKSEMKNNEQKIFELKRDSIRTHPCK
jgi:chromosome segregation ATPase